MSEFGSGESIIQRIYMFFPIFLLVVRGEVCKLGSPENPWVVKDRAVEQIIVRGWWFLMKTGFE